MPRTKGAKRAIPLVALLALIATTGTAHGLPAGGEIVTGEGSINESGDSLTVRQESDFLAVDWQTFSVGEDELVLFVQPGADAVALNRVLGDDPSEIFGRLKADGQVFLVNPHGIVFSETARVDVGGLVASALDVSVERLADGTLSLEALDVAAGSESAGRVVNRGEIAVAEGGVVAFLGTYVENAGWVLAPLGTVAAGAGERVTLGLDGRNLVSFGVEEAALDALVTNSGFIAADGGMVVLEARAQNALFDSVINVDGIIEARSLGEEEGVVVLRGGDAGVVEVSGTLDASGDGAAGGYIEVTGAYIALDEGARLRAAGAPGGEILVGGDYQGGSPVVPNARGVFVGEDVVLDASGRGYGAADGGRVIVWSDEATRFYGLIRATGAEAGGHGGFAEVSSPGYLDFRGLADLRAPRGKAGTLLLDPTDIIISKGVDDGVDREEDPENSGTWIFHPSHPHPDTATIDVDTLLTQLGLGDVVIRTASAGAGDGNIEIQASIQYRGADDRSLTLEADHEIIVHENVNITSESAKLNLRLESIGNRHVRLKGGNLIRTNGGNVSVISRVDGAKFDLGNNVTIDAGEGTLRFEVDRVLTGLPGEPAAAISAGKLELEGRFFHLDAANHGFGGLGNVSASEVYVRTAPGRFLISGPVSAQSLKLVGEGSVAQAADPQAVLDVIQLKLELPGRTVTLDNPGNNIGRIVYANVQQLTVVQPGSLVLGGSGSDDGIFVQDSVRARATGNDARLSIEGKIRYLGDALQTFFFEAGGSVAVTGADIRPGGAGGVNVVIVAHGGTPGVRGIEVSDTEIVTAGGVLAMGGGSWDESQQTFSGYATGQNFGIHLRDLFVLTSGAPIVLRGQGGSDGGLYVENTELQSTGGNVVMEGVATDESALSGIRTGIRLAGSTVKSGDGLIDLYGEAAAGDGVRIADSLISSFAGDITVKGVGKGTSLARGLVLENARVTSGDGELLLWGVAEERGTGNVGLLINNDPSYGIAESEGTGALTLRGEARGGNTSVQVDGVFGNRTSPRDVVILAGNEDESPGVQFGFATVRGRGDFYFLALATSPELNISDLSVSNVVSDDFENIVLGFEADEGKVNFGTSSSSNLNLKKDITLRAREIHIAGTVGETSPSRLTLVSDGTVTMEPFAGLNVSELLLLGGDDSEFLLQGMNTISKLAGRAGSVDVNLIVFGTGDVLDAVGGVRGVTATKQVTFRILGTGLTQGPGGPVKTPMLELVAAYGGTFRLDHSENEVGALRVSGADEVALTTLGRIEIGANTFGSATSVRALNGQGADAHIEIVGQVTAASGGSLELESEGGVSIGAAVDVDELIVRSGGADGEIQIHGPVTAARLTLGSRGLVTQADAGNITADSLVLNREGDPGEIGFGTFALNAAANAVGRLSGTGRSVTFYGVGNVTVGPLRFSETVQVVAGGNLNAGGSADARIYAGGQGNALTLAAGDKLVIGAQAGSDPFETPNGRLLVYVSEPTDVTPGNFSLPRSLYGRPFETHGPDTIELEWGSRVVYAWRPELTVKADDVDDLVYGQGLDPSRLTWTYSGLLDGDSLEEAVRVALTTSITRESEAATHKEAITYTSLTSPLGYRVTFEAGDVTIQPAPLTIAADDVSRVYGRYNPELTWTVSGLMPWDRLDEAADVFASTAATLESPVGQYVIKLGGAAKSNNYTVTFKDGRLTIRPAELTVRVLDANRPQGQPNPEFSVTYEGFVLNHDASVFDGELRFETDAAEDSPPGVYLVRPVGLTLRPEYAGNYTVKFVDGRLTVLAAAGPGPDGPGPVQPGPAESLQEAYHAVLIEVYDWLNADTAAMDFEGGSPGSSPGVELRDLSEPSAL